VSRHINSAFQEALRQLGRLTTPEELRHRGVARLRSVKTSDIALLIERAVNRTLMERTIGPLDADSMAEVLHAAENQFTRQLRDFEDLADSRRAVAEHRRETQVELAKLRASIEERRRAESAPGQHSVPRPDHERSLAREILACLQPLLRGGTLEGPGLDVAEDLRALVRVHVAEALELQQREFQLETAKQERRVAKLVESLERTEQVLARVAASKDLEEGIESVFRSVQGLSHGEHGFERKQALLQSIFESNQSLRRSHPFTPGFA
jgi:hypothetical protein